MMATCMQSEAERPRHVLTMLPWLSGKYSNYSATFCSECPANSTSAAAAALATSCFCNAGYWDIRNCTTACGSDEQKELVMTGHFKDDRLEAYDRFCVPCSPGAQH